MFVCAGQIDSIEEIDKNKIQGLRSCMVWSNARRVILYYQAQKDSTVSSRGLAEGQSITIILLPACAFATTGLIWLRIIVPEIRDIAQASRLSLIPLIHHACHLLKSTRQKYGVARSKACVVSTATG